MAINKNFVVKNGLEVDANLIYADADIRKVGFGTTSPQFSIHVIGGIGVTDVHVSGASTVLTELNVGLGGTVLTVLGSRNSFGGLVGIGTTNPKYELQVIGGIGATNSFITGVSTVLTELRVGTGGSFFSVIPNTLGDGQLVGVGTALPVYLLDIRSPVSTGQTALYVQGDVRITGDLSVDDISFDDATLSNITVTEALNVPNTGIGTIVNLVSTNATVTNLTGTAVTISYLTVTNASVSAFNVYDNVTVGGTSIFVNGPVTIGSTLLTGTPSQPLQVTGGAYISNNLGIGITTPQYELQVIGGIGATNSFITGISTVLTELNVGLGGTVLTVLGVGNSIGIGTALPVYLLDIRSPVSTGQTALYVQGDVRITGDLSVDDISFDDATLTNINVTGIATIATVDINAGQIDVSRIETKDINVTAGIATIATVDINAGQIDVSRIETKDIRVTTGIATISVGIITSLTNTNLNVTGIATIATLNSTNATLTNLNSTSATLTNLDSTDVVIANATIASLTGTAATIGNIRLLSDGSVGVITATTGVVMYYGDGSFLDLSGNIAVSAGGAAGNAWTHIISSQVLIKNTKYLVDSTIEPLTLTFPGPLVQKNPGDFIEIADAECYWDINNVTLLTQNNETFKDSTSIVDSTLVCDVVGAQLLLVWEGSYWRLFS
jgi:hypothetical protein